MVAGISSLRRRTLYEVNQEREEGKMPQLEKDIKSFNFQNLTHGK